MKLHSLIGKEILDIFVKIEIDKEINTIALWKANCYFVLTDNITIGLPFHFDSDEVWIKPLDPLAKSYYPASKWWRKKQISDKIRNHKITDIIDYPDEILFAFIELDSGKIITEVNVAPIGLSVGLKIFESIHELEKRYGLNYVRLSDHKSKI